MTQQELERAIQEVWALFKETDWKIEKSSLETDRKFRETDRKIQEVSKNVNNLTGKWFWFVDGLIAPGAATLFRERGIEVDRIFQQVKVHKKGFEIDSLADKALPASAGAPTAGWPPGMRPPRASWYGMIPAAFRRRDRRMASVNGPRRKRSDTEGGGASPKPGVPQVTQDSTLLPQEALSDPPTQP